VQWNERGIPTEKVPLISRAEKGERGDHTTKAADLWKISGAKGETMSFLIGESWGGGQENLSQAEIKEKRGCRKNQESRKQKCLTEKEKQWGAGESGKT